MGGPYATIKGSAVECQPLMLGLRGTLLAAAVELV
jgi:hypothetical protein